MAQNENLTFLGSLPVDTELVTLLDAAEGAERRFDTGSEEEDDAPHGSFPLLKKYLKTSSWSLFKEIVEKALVNIDRTGEQTAS